jgi:hypothetical protein
VPECAIPLTAKWSPDEAAVSFFTPGCALIDPPESRRGSLPTINNLEAKFLKLSNDRLLPSAEVTRVQGSELGMLYSVSGRDYRLGVILLAVN